MHPLIIWIWPFILAGLVYIGLYLYTKNKKESGLYAFKAFLIGFACFSIIEFELYLEGIFVGHYNKMGLPSHFSHSGWRLLIDAWPIWFVPLYLGILLKAFALWIYVVLKKPTAHHAAYLDPKHKSSFGFQSTPDPAAMQNRLEIQELKQKLEATNKHYEAIKGERFQYQTHIKQLELALKKAEKNPKSTDEPKEKLHALIKQQNQEIIEANELVEHLLQQLQEQDDTEEERDNFF